MISKKMEEALNKQIVKESYACSSYLSMASWCETKGLRGSASFFRVQSGEEREHALKLIKYLNESAGHGLVPAVKEPPARYTSLKEVFEISLKQEKDVTQSIHALADLAISIKDYASFNFLQWYVKEQHEEEHLFRSLLDIMNIADAEGKNMLLIDNEIAKIRGKDKE